MSRLLIINARVVNEGRIDEVDVLVDGDRIAQIGGRIEARPPVRVIDAAGRYLIPGMIDDQVHFREPGLTHKGDLATESAAAVAGGITSFMEMPNVEPQTTTREALENKYQRASGRARANYAFYLGATNSNVEELKRLRPGEACGIKIFMGASTGNLLVDDPDALESIFAEAPVIVVTHCEDSPMIWANEKRARDTWGDAIPMSEHPLIRSADACLASSTRAIDLARRHDARLHILHLTTAAEMDLFSSRPTAEKRITAEVCVHHLFFEASDYDRLGTKIKCNPAIKFAADRDALRQAVLDGKIDVIATDHAPHTAAEKANENYFKAPAGLPLVQHALVSVLELVHDGLYPIELVVEKTSHAVANLFGVNERGFIREGYFADLALVNTANPWEVTADTLLYKCGWSPFEGMTFRSSIDMTIINGQIVWENGALHGEPVGQRLDLSGARL